MSEQDKFLLEQLKLSNVTACKELFKSYYKLLTAQAFYLLGDEMEAEDTVQNLFIELWERRAQVNINSSLKSYLQTSIHHKCLNTMQKKKIVQRKFDEYISTLDPADADFPYEKHESETALAKLMDTLSSQQYLAFNLVHLEDKRYKDAAAEMGVSVNSLKTHLKLAIKGLKRRLIQTQ